MKYKGADVLKIMAAAKNYNNFLADFALSKLKKSNDFILDFGAGTGTFPELLRKRGFNMNCVEIDDSLREIITSKGFEAHKEISVFPDNSIENMVSFNVFEHIENDREVLAEVYKKLKPDGIFFFFVPANSFLYSLFDERLGHFRRYDMEPALDMLEEAGFTIKEYEYFDTMGFILAYIYKLINKTGGISKFSIVIFDKFLFPISVILDKFFNKKFGKNIAVVLTK